MHENLNRLLVVETDQGALSAIVDVANRLGFAVATTSEPTEFLQLVDDFSPSAIVMDIQIPEADGVELFHHLLQRDCRASIILTAESDPRVISAAMDVGRARGLKITGAIQKPLKPADLQVSLADVFTTERKIGLADLETALRDRQLVAYYQPKASLMESGGWLVDGLEALVRWMHPTLGLVMPDEFIPLAERSGLIGELTEQVLGQALGQLKAWNDDDLRLKCAVNLAPSLVTDLTLPDRIVGMIADFGLDVSQLTLELTETATMQDPTASMDILTRLRVKGIGLSLDDFGTGFSSLTRLHQMPFDEMKIDKSLVMNVPRSREANTIVGSLIELGHNLGLKICAEGVESRAALDLLEILQCDRCQGFFIGRALPAEDIPSFVKRWNETSPASSTLKPAKSAV